MTTEELDAILGRVEETIDKKVNGKIDKLNNKLDPKHEDYILKDIHQHMDEVKPILEAYNGTKALGNLAKWVGGLIVTIAAAWAIIFKQ